MVRIFLVYVINGKKDAIRAEKETMWESINTLHKTMINAQLASGKDITSWVMSNMPSGLVSNYDLIE